MRSEPSGVTVTNGRSDTAATSDRDQAGRRWRLSAYAKVNLGLEILGRRDDGFHEIVSVTQTVSLADTLEVTTGGPFRVEVTPPLADDGENLAERAGHALAAATGRTPTGRLTVRKRIPVAAGLGGGSSDAAASLRLLDRAWGTRLGDACLAEVGAALGSDVPLFLAGSTSLIRGRGEIVEPLPPPPTFWLVLVTAVERPPDKTRAMYRALAPADWTDGARTLTLTDCLRAGQPVGDALLINGFDAAADRVYPELRGLRDRLAGLLGAPVHLTGAGPTVFALFGWADAARQAAHRARRAGLPALVASSIVGRPTIRASKAALAR
jgi:4-diphosphocytidyl-2-C-methyl-D-erythritol kinase